MNQAPFFSLLLAGLLVSCLPVPLAAPIMAAEQDVLPAVEEAGTETKDAPASAENQEHITPGKTAPLESEVSPEEQPAFIPPEPPTPEVSDLEESSTPEPPVAPPEAEESIIRREDETPAASAQRRRSRSRTAVHRGAGGERVEVGKSVVVERGEVVRELVVIAGNARVDGTVEGSVVVISGSARINGRVRQDLVTVLGSATLGQNGRVGHDVVVVGGPLNVHEQAVIGGQQTVVALGPMVPDLMWLQRWVSNGLLLARPFPPRVKWVWGVAALCLLLYLALAVIFPHSVRTCVGTLERQPVASFFIGVLLFVLLGPLLFLLVVSVAGILVIPILMCAVAAAIVFGKVAVYSYAGLHVGRQLNRPEVSLPVVLLIGTGLFYLVYMVPVLGFAVWGIVTLLGAGAVLLAAFGSFRQETAPAYATSMATVPVPSEKGGGTAAPFTAGSVTVPVTPPMLTAGDAALLPRVGFWRRFTATLLDFVLLALLIPFAGPLFVLIWAGYHLGMWTWRGTTIGGIIMNIKIVRLDGQPIDFGIALVRCLSSFFSAFALFLGFFWAGWDHQRQAWHDKIAGTVIVQYPKGMPLL